MKSIYYLRYFFFIAYHWNPRLAWFTIRHEIRGEKKYSINTTRLDNLEKHSLKGSPGDAESYQGANYFLLEHVFEKMDLLHRNNHIVDFGCGKGRVLAVAAFYSFNTITGVEFSKELCREAKKTIIRIQEKFPRKRFSIIHANAVDYVIEDNANVFFFFNPFNEKIMLAVVKNILLSLKNRKRKVYVLYLNPVHKEIFLSAGFEEKYHFEKLRYIEASILVL